MADASLAHNQTTEDGNSAVSERRAVGASLFVGLTRMLAALPFSVRSALGWGLGYLVGLLPLRERRFTLLQLQVFLPSLRAGRVTPRVFANAGRTLLESLNLKPILTPSSRKLFACPAWDSIERWTKEERPIIALTGHTGNWDLFAAYIISRGIPLTTVGREARNPAAQAILRAMREGYGIETIWRSDRTGLKRLMNCLKERRVVAALIDQDTRVESLMIPFFGTPAKTPSSLVALGKKYNARFVSAFMFRVGRRSFEAYVEEFPENLSEEELLTEYNRRLENLVRRYPDQWVWFHKRWRTIAVGETLSSRQYEQELKARLRGSSKSRR